MSGEGPSSLRKGKEKEKLSMEYNSVVLKLQCASKSPEKLDNTDCWGRPQGFQQVWGGA